MPVCFSDKPKFLPGEGGWGEIDLPHRWQVFVQSCPIHSLSQNGPAGGKQCFDGAISRPAIMLLNIGVYPFLPNSHVDTPLS